MLLKRQTCDTIQEVETSEHAPGLSSGLSSASRFCIITAAPPTTGRATTALQGRRSAYPIGMHMDPDTRRKRVRSLTSRDGYACHYCLKAFTPGRDEPTVDHITPRSQGGTNHLDNLVLACAECNTYRGARYSYAEWVAIRRGAA